MNTKSAKPVRTRAEELEAARQLGIMLREERQRAAALMEEDLLESEEIWEKITSPTNPNPPR